MMTQPLVTISVCTRNRPEGIRACLESLLLQETDFPYEIVCVENDVQQKSREIVESFIAPASEKGVELRYFCEPVQNIAGTRNHGMREARGEFVAILDDDEWAASDWLAKLMEVQRETDADAVWGIVKAQFPPEYPECMKHVPNLKLFAEAVDLQKIWAFCTNNLLLRRTLTELREPFFDLDFGISGCSDAELSCFLDGAGKKMIRTNRAVVYELQPLSRASLHWQTRKVYCVTNAVSRVYRKHFYRINGNLAILKLFGRSFCSCFRECLRIPFSPQTAYVCARIHAAGMLGILAYYLRFRPRSY